MHHTIFYGSVIDLHGPQSTSIYLVRHGMTAWNLAGRLQGRTDIPLTERGRAEAACAATALQGRRYAAIYSSPLQRAYESATIIARQLGLSVRIEGDLIERAYGEWEGQTLKGRGRTSEETVLGVEPAATLRQRAVGCLTQIALRHLGEALVAVSHGAWINALVFVVTRGKAGTGITNLANGGITHLSYDPPDTWHLVALNQVAHLAKPHGQTDRRRST